MRDINPILTQHAPRSAVGITSSPKLAGWEALVPNVANGTLALVLVD